MTISIPNEIIQRYHEATDAFITDLGVNCQINYPPRRISCANCTSSLSGGSTNIYRHGGPAPFNFGICPLCGGKGFKEDVATDDITVRAYWSQKDWIKLAEGINSADSEVMIIGFMSDLPTVRRANEFVLPKNIQGQKKWRYALDGEVLPHGLGGVKRYFIAFLKRV